MASSTAWPIPQLYGEVAYNDLTVKVGRFYSPVGYYVVGTANNFFPVLPYTFQYGEPFTHTGMFGTYKFSDALTLGGGITHGWDNSDNTGNPHAGGLAHRDLDDRRAALAGLRRRVWTGAELLGRESSSIVSPLGPRAPATPTATCKRWSIPTSSATT